MTGSIGTEARPGSRLTGMWARMKVQCGNCYVWVPREDAWQCPDCRDWICLGDDPDIHGWPYCMIHEGGKTGSVCADCCDGHGGRGCDTCALDYCEDCSEQWDDCECDDDDDD